MFKSDDLYQAMQIKISKVKMEIAEEALEDIENAIKNNATVTSITDEIDDLKIFLTTK